MDLSLAHVFDFYLFSMREGYFKLAHSLSLNYTLPQATVFQVLHKLQISKSQICSSIGNITCSSQWRLWLWTPGPLGLSSALVPTPALFFPQQQQPQPPSLLACSWISLQVLVVTKHDITHPLTPLTPYLKAHMDLGQGAEFKPHCNAVTGNRSTVNSQCPTVNEAAVLEVCI